MPAGWLASFLILVALGAPRSAPAAALVIGADGNVVIGLRQANDSTTGFSIDPRVGIQLDTKTLRFTPEVMASFARFGKADRISLATQDHTSFRVVGGFRLASRTLVAPSFFVHGGLGRHALGDRHQLGPAFDAGLALDYTGIRYLSVGAQASYNAIAIDSLFDWVGIGLHAAVIF
ncbi:hypothetical protein AKJ08_3644 [Vulgatibacter incomptus]|uniref:Outer membrane protein beta-barrel domain-containing protein n=1 Tax=Vulgatibacter incomptus TaxID=1391653 RepID=A0A0K1PID0_9BACT|nr:hypothetical protein AKJ08_3644 [Vulgatibacter incomptus]